ncbi:fatty acid hydroxylase family protein [Salegentibacter sp. 24]|jgi:sterol desaturase/sphingolipid hydroxylase (fatty acid hydroxylase superfamily)|uniref:sterol desaturase family protein n=1 Tax=Salegentibacter sp. 24 TaxID=2183986 RepID=UPI00105FDCAF|nr:sterol desaturase family protein [Salegentibacter sp. 24]TDN90468.1 fatty acid hydroxylase family protein [Salegentibacter sp. 24]
MESTKLKRPKHKGSPKLFNNPILEKLTHTHISIPLIIFGVIAAALIYYGIIEKGFKAPLMIGLFITGLFFFTFVEYIMHRYLYHLPATSERKKKISYTMHGVHHDYPKDKSRLAMPPVLSLIIATVLFIIYRAVLGDYVFGFLAGFLIGYAAYLAVHYSVHAFKVPDNFLKILWHHHSIHHYRESDRAFGVSSPLWDHIFRTMPRKAASSRKTAVGQSIDD